MCACVCRDVRAQLAKVRHSVRVGLRGAAACPERTSAANQVTRSSPQEWTSRSEQGPSVGNKGRGADTANRDTRSASEGTAVCGTSDAQDLETNSLGRSKDTLDLYSTDSSYETDSLNSEAPRIAEERYRLRLRRALVRLNYVLI